MTFSTRRIVSTIGSVNSGFYSHLVLSTWDSVKLGVSLLGILFNWVFVYLDFVYIGVWPHEILYT